MTELTPLLHEYRQAEAATQLRKQTPVLSPCEETILNTSNKAKTIALYILLAVPALLYSLGKALYDRCVTWVKGPSELDKAIDGLAQSRLTAIRQAVFKHVDDDPEVRAVFLNDYCRYTDSLSAKGYSKKEISLYKKNLADLFRLLETEPEIGNYHNHCQELRNALNALLTSPIYQNRKADRENASDVLFLQTLANALTHRAGGMEHIRKYGKVLEQEYCQDMKREDYATDGAFLNAKLMRIFEQINAPRKETVWEKLVWTFLHPNKTWNSLCGHIRAGGMAERYNSFQHGNANIFAGNYHIGNTSIAFSFGPGPTGDRVMEASLQFAKNYSKRRTLHIQQSFEHPGKAGEDLRRRTLLRMAQNNETMQLSSMPMDGPAWKLSKEFKHLQGEFSIEGYYSTLQSFVNDEGDETSLLAPPGYLRMDAQGSKDNGFYLPGMAEPEIETTINTARSLMKDVTGGNAAWDTLLSLEGPKDQARKGKVCLLTFELLTAMKEVVKIAQKLREINQVETELDKQLDATLGQACKQDIDRGIIMNVMMRIAFELHRNGTLDADTISEIVGQVFIRAQMVDRRILFRDRLEGLSDWIAVILASDETKNTFISHLRNYLKDDTETPLDLGFTASDRISI